MSGYRERALLLTVFYVFNPSLIFFLMIQWHIHVFCCRHMALSVHPLIGQSVGPSCLSSLNLQKRVFLRLPLWLCVCEYVWDGQGCEWGLPLPTRPQWYCDLFLLLDPSFNLSATIFQSDCLAISFFFNQIVCPCLYVLPCLFFVSLCVSCTDVLLICYLNYPNILF